MRQNELYTLIFSVIRAGLDERDIEAEVAQAYNATQQGVPTGPSIFINAASTRRYGFLGRRDVWNPTNQNFDHVEVQQLESAFQIGTSVIQEPSNTSQMTAEDLAQIVANILNGDKGRQAIQQAGAQVYRITDVRIPQFIDDRGRFETYPNFIFTVTHEDVTLSTNPVVETFELQIDSV